MNTEPQQPDSSEPFVPPWKRQTLWQRWWRWLLQLRQWVFLALLVLLSWFLWLQVLHHAQFPAYAIQHIHSLYAPIGGIFKSLLVEKGQAVKQGQVLLHLEDPTLQVELQIAQKEKANLEALLVREAWTFRLSQLALQTRLQMFVDEAQTSWLTEQTRSAMAKGEWKALQKEWLWLRKVREQQLGRTDRLGLVEARKQSLEALFQAMPRILQVYRQKQQRARSLLNQHNVFAGKPAQELLDKILKPLQMQWAAQVLRIQRLQLLLERMTLRAPVSGVIQEILVQPGAFLQAGTPLLRMVRDNLGWVQAYVEESMARRVVVGMMVQVSLRYPEPSGVSHWFEKQALLCASVVGLGALEPIPLRFRSIPQKPQWVRPVTLRLRRPLLLVPGELMFVKFSPGDCKP